MVFGIFYATRWNEMMLVISNNISPETRLLDTARRLFCREGINATGITRIIQEAGVARKTLYNHYGSKENLLRAVIKIEADMWFEWFDHDIPQTSADPNEQILTIFKLLKEWFSSNNFYGCIFINAVAEHDKIDSWVRDVALEHREKINSRIRNLTSNVGCTDPVVTAEKIGLLIDGAIVNAMITRDPELADLAKSIAKDILSHS